jgi:hypothetical protein
MHNRYILVYTAYCVIALFETCAVCMLISYAINVPTRRWSVSTMRQVQAYIYPSI